MCVCILFYDWRVKNGHLWVCDCVLVCELCKNILKLRRRRLQQMGTPFAHHPSCSCSIVVFWFRSLFWPPFASLSPSFSVAPFAFYLPFMYAHMCRALPFPPLRPQWDLASFLFCFCHPLGSICVAPSFAFVSFRPRLSFFSFFSWFYSRFMICFCFILCLF